MVFGKFIPGDGDLSVVREIRESVFEGELGVPSRGTDMPDAFCMHAVASAEDVPVGTGRILFDGDRFAIAGIAVGAVAFVAAAVIVFVVVKKRKH